MIAFLHTTSTLLERFEDLVRKYDSDIEIRHFVQEKLLQTASETGKADITAFENAVEKIHELQPATLICTCSTYGDACDTRTDIDRIDQPVVEHLVNTYQKIGVAFTAKSTKEATENLIRNMALLAQKPIQIQFIDCSEYWQYFEAGDSTRYHQEIAKKITAESHQADVFFLAQASMEGAKDFLKPLDKEVYSSPEFGIKTYLHKLKSKTK